MGLREQATFVLGVTVCLGQSHIRKGKVKRQTHWPGVILISRSQTVKSGMEQIFWASGLGRWSFVFALVAETCKDKVRQNGLSATPFPRLPQPSARDHLRESAGPSLR